MDNIIALLAVLILIGFAFGLATLVIPLLLAGYGLFGLMVASGWIYTKITGKSWDDVA